MIPWAGASQLISNLIGTLQGEERDAYDKDKTEILNGGRCTYGSVKIGFKEGTSRDTLWRTKKLTDMVCRDPADRLAPPPGYTYPDAE
eukprot:721328-Pyramimonas_sp.AAC.1